MTIDAECFVGRAGTYGVGELLIDVRVMDSGALVPRWRPSLYSKPLSSCVLSSSDLCGLRARGVGVRTRAERDSERSDEYDVRLICP